MIYSNLIKYIGDIAKAHPLVKEFNEGDVYQLNAGEHKYGNVICTLNSATDSVNIYKYDLTLFYIDRLTESQSNKVAVQTDAMIVLQQVINYMKNHQDVFDFDLPVSYTPFTERFTDSCAGAFCTINITTRNIVGNCDFDYAGIILEPIEGITATNILDNYYTKAEVELLIANALNPTP